MRILTDVPLPATEDNVEFIECPPPRLVLRVFSVQNKISYQALLQKERMYRLAFPASNSANSEIRRP